jgi:predicted molibdopterin-dependent oxidoreductase YjgC
VAARVRPELTHTVRFKSSQQIRDEISRVIPLYAGIERLSKEGDNFQWGGPTLFADGKFATFDGKAHFSAPIPKERRPPEGKFYLSTRRAKQFNSMVQRAFDPLTGALRNEVLISQEDAVRLGIKNGESIRLVPVSEVILDGRRLTKSSQATSKSTGPKATACYFTRRSIPPLGSRITMRP